IYETEPVSNTPQGKFLNGVIEIKTSLRPKTLLSKLNAIEDNLGRKRDGINMPRTIDLDILYYGNERIEEEGLIVPHPRIREREFVLKGLRELAPSLIR
ncbi:MAG: 2-amino-4-hydroxy-6-hydroxymethyldihydropteridine diphosphokinase, partial [Candidatus Omnitrophica bacterium]|nr:2-amino-4-hydroxy-6-hydroxymethyldihydropteridine diphosphokinase [Candidatus Omnitrophota bacterium]